ncbi:MAG: F0F1 ATP synthase subunit epsilon [Acidobacteriota bacterium]
MRLKVLLPSGIILDKEVSKVIVESENGSFCFLPKHIDCVLSLVPGILSYVSGGEETFMAVDSGVLVKAGPLIQVSTRMAVEGEGLGRLREAVEERFRNLDEKEKKSRSALARFEADFIRRFWELEKNV